MTPSKRSNIRTVTANSFWYGLDSLLSLVLALLTSIPLARKLGPTEELGYFNYVLWLVTASGAIASLGVPGTAGKFIAELRGGSGPATTRAVFEWAFVRQVTVATIVTAAGLVLVFAAGDPRYHTVTAFLVAAILPSMLTGVVTHANLGNENMRANIPGSIGSNLLYLGGVLLSLWIGWDLLGVAVTLLFSKTFDLAARLFTARTWLRDVPRSVLPPELRLRMRSFAKHQMVLGLLAMIVWDKSDILFLKYFANNVREVAEITFFTMAVNLADKGVLMPKVLGLSLEATLLAQYGRNRESLAQMTRIAGRYVLLASMPLLFGLALVSGPLVAVLYGGKFPAVAPILALAATLAALRPLQEPIDAVFRAHGKQGPLVKAAIACAILNIALDLALIPYFGPIGAAAASGTAQAVFTAGIWIVGARLFSISLDWSASGKIFLASIAMAVPIALINRSVPPLAALPLDVAAGIAVLLLVLRLTRALNESDANRLNQVWQLFPSFIRPALRSVLHFVARPQAGAAMVS